MIKYFNQNEIYEQWAPLLESKTGITDKYKLNWLSIYCHNHSAAESLNEQFSYSTASTLGALKGMGPVTPPAAPGGPVTFYTGQVGSGDKFPSLLPIAIQVAAKTVGLDIVSVIPMNGPVGTLTYIDYFYSGGKLASDQKPMMIKINAGNINNTKYTVGSKYWGVSAASNGTNFPSDAKIVELVFVGYSRIDGYPIFRVGSTFVATGTGNNKTLDATVTLSDVFDGSAVITIDSSNGPHVGNATANTIAVTAKPQLVKALEDHIFGPTGAGTYDQDTWFGPEASGTLPVTPMSRGTGESTYYRMYEMGVFNKFVEAETVQAAIHLKTEQIQDLNRMYGLDLISMVENTLINELTQTINKHILSRAFALGWSNNAAIYKTSGKTLNFTVDPSVTSSGSSPSFVNKLGFTESVPYSGFMNFGNFENLTTIQRRIKSRIFAASQIIAQRGRRGPANFVVTNVQIATALMDAANYSIAPMANNFDQQSGMLYPIGQLAGMTVYVDPNMGLDDTRILVGRKGEDDEPGLKFCPYLIAETIQTIAEGTMAPKLAVKSRYALVEAGHHPETQYLTLYVHLGNLNTII